MKRVLLVLAPLVALFAVLFSTGAAQASLRVLGIGGASAPANDDFAAAATVGGGSFDGTTAAASAESAEVAAGFAAAADNTVWFSWVPSQSGTADITSISGRSPQVHVFTGTDLATLTSVAEGASVAVPAFAGTTYKIQVLDTDGGGAFSETLTQPGNGHPDGDSFAAPVSLDQAIAAQAAGASGPVAQGSTAGAIPAEGEPADGAAAPQHTVWYSYDATSTGHLTLSTRATTPADAGPLSLAVFTGDDITTLTRVNGPAESSIGFDLSPGAAYRIELDGPEQYFSLTATLSGVSGPDTTAPVITCPPAPTGWVRVLSVTCTATDPGSGLAHASDASFSLSVDVPAGTTAPGATTGSHSVCDQAGNCATSPAVTADVDSEAPAVTCAAPPVGWSSAAVSVTCTAADAGSGLAGAGSFDLRADVPAGTAGPASFGTHPDVCDQAGNCAPVPAVADANVDHTLPVVACDSPPGSAWADAEISVTCTSADEGSGLAAASDAKITLQTSIGAGGFSASAATNSVRVCDTAGNCATAGPVTGLRVDESLPVVACPADTAWHAGTTLAVTCRVTDDGSGVAGPAEVSLTAAIPPGTSSDTATTGSAQVCDVAGNCSAAGPVTSVRLDDRAPALACQPTPVRWLKAAVTDVCTVTDDGSGVPSATVELSTDVPDGTANPAVPLPAQQVCDAVGNCVATPAEQPAAIDRKTPTVVCAAPPARVQHFEVTVACSPSDADSGLVDPAPFTLSTSVGAGNADASAQTSTHTVCDLAGNCTVAGPLSADVDRTAPPSQPGPGLTAPTRVTVIAAVADDAQGLPGRVPVPYVRPDLTAPGVGQVAIGCAPDSGVPFTAGTTTVACGATDAADRTASASFPVEVTSAPSLAGGAVGTGSTATIEGPGFVPGSTPSLELDGVTVGSGTVDPDGTAGGALDLPVDLPYGPHTLVLRGVDPDGQPHLVVEPLTAVSPSSLETPAPTAPPGGPTPGSPGASSAPATGPSAPVPPRSPSRRPSPSPKPSPSHPVSHRPSATPTTPGGAITGSGPTVGSGPGQVGLPQTGSSANGGGSVAGGPSGGVVGAPLQPGPGNRVGGSTASPSPIPGPTQTFGGGAPSATPSAQAAAPSHGARPGGGFPWWAILLIVLGALALLALLALLLRRARPAT